MIFRKIKKQTDQSRLNIEGFENLFREHYSALCMFACGIVKDMDSAEEIVQDFFFNFWQKKDSIIINTSYKTYFYTAVQNNCLKHLRGKNVRIRYAETLQTQEPTLYSQTQEDFEAKELQGVIDRVLEKLPQRDEMIFRMNRYDGLKYREISQILNISIKTVEAAMGRTLAVFRVKLSDYGNFETARKLTKKTITD